MEYYTSIKNGHYNNGHMSLPSVLPSHGFLKGLFTSLLHIEPLQRCGGAGRPGLGFSSPEKIIVFTLFPSPKDIFSSLLEREEGREKKHGCERNIDRLPPISPNQSLNPQPKHVP